MTVIFTLTRANPSTPFKAAWMVAVPRLNPCVRPVGETKATVGGEADQLTASFSVSPLLLITTARSCTWSNRFTVVLSGMTLMLAGNVGPVPESLLHDRPAASTRSRVVGLRIGPRL